MFFRTAAITTKETEMIRGAKQSRDTVSHDLQLVPRDEEHDETNQAQLDLKG